MNFTSIFIKRPVLATVISLLILFLGLRAIDQLNVREYPKMENAVVTVTTVYTGANAELVKGFITTPLEREIASADGIDYLESTSAQNVSTISAHLKINYDPNAALTQITSKVNKVRSELPQGSEDPTIDVSVGETTAAMYMSFFSNVLDSNQITDYLTRVVQPKLAAVSGVQSAEILGARTFAMRVWLKPDKMAAYNISAAQVRQILQANNYLAAVGSTKGTMITVNLNAKTDLHTPEEFKQMIVKHQGDTIVRLKDIADVELGAESYDSTVQFGGENATFIGIKVLPTANVLTVIQKIRKLFPEIKAQLPNGIHASIPYDATAYIQDSIHEVITTLAEALGIVIVVIFMFLGSVRHVAIPVVSIPLSLIGGIFIMLVLGFSINLLTLLAMVLAIGLVVDDAIIVVENIHRHIEEGLTPFQASLKGARELGTAVIAMTITLMAVYAPIGFLGGLTGSLFKEFAFSLAGCVLISGVVALTLSPMLCSKMLKPETGKQGFAHFLDQQFEKWKNRYERLLHSLLNTWPVMVAFGIIVLILCAPLFLTSKKEQAPTEDQGIIIASSTAAPNATIDQTTQYTKEITKAFQSFPETANIFQINGYSGSNTAISGMVLKPWSERSRSQMQLMPLVQQKLNAISGLKTVAFARPPLPGSSGLPIQFVIGTTDSPLRLNTVAESVLQAAQKSGMFMFVDSDLKYDQPQVSINIDREKAADLGLNMQQIGGDLASMLGGGYVNRFSIQGRAYKVIPLVKRVDRLNASQLLNYYVPTSSGKMVPVSTFASLKTTVEPESLKRFQQLNSATISGVPMPGVTMGQALDFLKSKAKQLLPAGYTYDYSGQSRQYVQESSALIITFFFALIIIYLVLSAQFESFTDPLIMLISVPMSIAGALIFINVGFASINIYTEVGLITLIGLISKHGILIVQFANQLQEEGMPKRQAIEEAAGIRLRPILMTTAAMVLGVVPLLIATGAGAASRFNIGLVIASGMSIGTLFTLFVVPSVYMLLGRDHAKHAQKTAEAQSSN